MFTDAMRAGRNGSTSGSSKPGTVFMAVGAGHLAGDRSVVALLKNGRASRYAASSETRSTRQLAFRRRLARIGARLPTHGHPWRRGGASIIEGICEMSEQLTLPAERANGLAREPPVNCVAMAGSPP